jgi:anaerobic magnesium-protoporphyrin IX monomethyl ester cyclase
MKPENMEREDVLKGVLRNYARFYMRKTIEYWFVKDPFKRRYLLGCLKAFVKTTLNKRFYNLSRVKRKGWNAEIELGFDQSKVFTLEELAKRKQEHPEWAADVNFAGTISSEKSEGDREHLSTS